MQCCLKESGRQSFVTQNLFLQNMLFVVVHILDISSNSWYISGIPLNEFFRLSMADLVQQNIPKISTSPASNLIVFPTDSYQVNTAYEETTVFNEKSPTSSRAPETITILNHQPANDIKSIDLEPKKGKTRK